MFERRSLRPPIILGVVMIVLVVVMIVGWIITTALSAVSSEGNSALFWTLLAVGTSLLGIMLVGVVMYLTLSVKAINLSLRQSNFIDSVTHELKSPIASLKLCLQTVSRGPLAEQDRANIERYMLEDVERLDQLINHLLEAARSARATQPRVPELVRLDQLLRECAEGVALRYRVADEVIELNVPACQVEGFHEDLAIMFRNLIDNAVKYAGDPPRVQVTASLGTAGELCVQIADNGRGIPAHLRRQVFGRFIRLGSELERDRPGTGLGLFIVRNLAQRMRCRVRIREGIGGAGTTFEVTLPPSMKAMLVDEPARVPSETSKPG